MSYSNTEGFLLRLWEIGGGAQRQAAESLIIGTTAATGLVRKGECCREWAQGGRGRAADQRWMAQASQPRPFLPAGRVVPPGSAP